MAWLRIDDGFDHHPKILALGSDQRRWTWIRVLIYTCRYRNPTIPRNITDSVPRATPQFLSECVELGLVDVTDEGTQVVHDWADYQAGDPKKAARQRRWRNGSVDGDVDADVDGNVDGDVDASRVGARARPVPNPYVENSPTEQEYAGRPPGWVENLGLYTGCRMVRGEAGVNYVPDVLGTDPPPGYWTDPRPTRAEVRAALDAREAVA